MRRISFFNEQNILIEFYFFQLHTKPRMDQMTIRGQRAARWVRFERNIRLNQTIQLSYCWCFGVILKWYWFEFHFLSTCHLDLKENNVSNIENVNFWISYIVSHGIIASFFLEELDAFNIQLLTGTWTIRLMIEKNVVCSIRRKKI